MRGISQGASAHQPSSGSTRAEPALGAPSAALQCLILQVAVLLRGFASWKRVGAGGRGWALLIGGGLAVLSWIAGHGAVEAHASEASVVLAPNGEPSESVWAGLAAPLDAECAVIEAEAGDDPDSDGLDGLVPQSEPLRARRLLACPRRIEADADSSRLLVTDGLARGPPALG